MKIIIDAMGADLGPKVVVEGAIEATKIIDDEIVLVGKEDIIKKYLKMLSYKGEQISIVNAKDVIENSEKPVRAIRTKKDSSMVVGMTMIKENEGDVFISAGSTGAIIAGGLFILGRIQGIDRPALATIYPVIGKEPSILLDSGANVECKPNNLLEFATMGSIYMEKVLKRKNPTVGILNNGTEEGKGTTLTHAAYELLDKSHLNFKGNIEGRELPFGTSDVIVTDGFTGNIALKLTEGMGLMVLEQLKKRFTSSTKAKMGALLLKEQLLAIKEEFNYAEYGGSPLLGVKGGILKMHGSSDALGVMKTIVKAKLYVEEDVVQIIQNSVLEIEEIIIGQ